MFGKTVYVGVSLLVLAGCASVPMGNKEESAKLKGFGPPTEGNAGLYIYRGGGPGAALKKDVWVDGRCIGETAPNVFFYEEVKGGEDHKVSTESEFSPNDLVVKAAPGQNYFIRQYIKMGLFVGGAGLELVDSAKAKESLKKLGLATKGHCSAELKK